jgi:superfamily I DNA and/or RNA helicase
VNVAITRAKKKMIFIGMCSQALAQLARTIWRVVQVADTVRFSALLPVGSARTLRGSPALSLLLTRLVAEGRVQRLAAGTVLL